MKKTTKEIVCDSVRSPIWVFSGKPIWDSVGHYAWDSICNSLKNFAVNNIHNSIDDFTKQKFK